MLPVDGLWIDMNEISNFCNGACNNSQSRMKVKYTAVGNPGGQGVKDAYMDWAMSKSGMRTRLRKRGTGSDSFNSPYTINNDDHKAPLNTKTLDMTALHMNSTVTEYNAHNLYSLSEAIATSNALETLTKKRSFVLSRSTFPGSGAHTAHWTGMISLVVLS